MRGAQKPICCPEENQEMRSSHARVVTLASAEAERWAGLHLQSRFTHDVGQLVLPDRAAPRRDAEGGRERGNGSVTNMHLRSLEAGHRNRTRRRTMVVRYRRRLQKRRVLGA